MTIKEISRIALIGAGVMGTRIAFRCLMHGKTVNIYDISPGAVKRSTETVRKWIENRVIEAQLTKEEAHLKRNDLRSSPTIATCCQQADIIIETISEDIDMKRKLFREIALYAPQNSLVATNSSSILCSRISNEKSLADRLFNINFSNPADEDDKLVELMPGPNMNEETLNACEKFIGSLDMVPIVTRKEIMGFSFNRIWRAIKKEALLLVDQGYSDFENIDRAWMLEFKTPQGPFGMMDDVGLDVVRDIELQYYNETGDDRDKPPKLIDDMIAQGRLGVKTGKGFYAYPNPEYKRKGWLEVKGAIHDSNQNH